jgi:hypothetical protein
MMRGWSSPRPASFFSSRINDDKLEISDMHFLGIMPAIILPIKIDVVKVVFYRVPYNLENSKI